jgi:polyisoprenoid-binding protein YceI
MMMMNRRPLFLASAALFGLVATAAAESKSFEVDANHSIFGFTASTILFDVQGHFEKYKVTVSGDPETAADAKVMIELDTKSINTGIKGRDDHLRSPDFFDATKNPKITFTSTSVKKEGSKITVEGTLDMHGQKKPLVIPFESVSAKNGAGIMENVYKAELPLSRKDFGIGSDSVAAKISLSDKVVVKLLLAGFFEAKKGK